MKLTLELTPYQLAALTSVIKEAAGDIEILRPDGGLTRSESDRLRAIQVVQAKILAAQKKEA